VDVDDITTCFAGYGRVYIGNSTFSLRLIGYWPAIKFANAQTAYA